MRKTVISLEIAFLAIVFFSSCAAKTPDPSSDSRISSPDSSDVSSADESVSESLSDQSEILGLAGQIYAIDKMYIDEMNENLQESSVVKGEITYKYTEQWRRQMEYYYAILYDALDTDGKEALEFSQKSWQTAFDAELELNTCIQTQNMILYDVFDNPKYTAYRNRAISLYLKCLSMNNIGECVLLE